MLRLIYLLLLLTVATGCAGYPEGMEGGNYADLRPYNVAANPDNFKGQSVLWGGVIVEVVNYENETWVEILALELNAYAKPFSSRMTNYGRFIAKTSDFLDPEVYQKGLRITVAGILIDPVDGKIGERPYKYPVVNITNYHLWPNRVRHHHYVVPGHWYFGMHPYWRFGYPYFGYGIWRYDHQYFPYFPVYGYLSRSPEKPAASYRPGNFSYQLRDNFNVREQSRLFNFQNMMYLGASRSRHVEPGDRRGPLRAIPGPVRAQTSTTTTKPSRLVSTPRARTKPSRTSPGKPRGKSLESQQ